jgi:DNA-directed RNA polymerase specialized sigma24 family protein
LSYDGDTLSFIKNSSGDSLLPDHIRVDFVEFVRTNEPRLRHALTATLGFEDGKEAAAEAFAYGWEHWDRVGAMDNPVGYLYSVGRSKGRKLRSWARPFFPEIPEDRTPWFEPGLPAALARLPEKERTVVLLLHGYGWHLTEVAETLGVAKSTVQTHAERGMRKLRRQLGVER